MRVGTVGPCTHAEGRTDPGQSLHDSHQQFPLTVSKKVENYRGRRVSSRGVIVQKRQKITDARRC